MGDFAFLEWWGGLSRGLRFTVALAMIGLGVLLWVTDIAAFWSLALVVTGVVLFIAAIELRNEA